MKRSRVIYVAGPLTTGDMLGNVRRAIGAGMVLRDLGYVPIVPHQSAFTSLMHPRSYEYWMALDFELIRLCDTLLRLEGESPGSDREVTFAGSLGVRVLYGRPGIRVLTSEAVEKEDERMAGETSCTSERNCIEHTHREWLERAAAGIRVRVRSVHSGATGTIVASGPKDAGCAVIVHWDEEPDRDALAEAVYLEEV